MEKFERGRTDGSLDAERSRSDEELADKRAAIEADEDRIIARARGRANEVLERARARADRRITDTSAREAVRAERRGEDSALIDERADADSAMAHERAASRRAVAELFAEERARTDEHLAGERASADDAITARDTFLGMVSHLLDVVSIEAGRLKVRPEPHEANMLVRETMEAFQPMAAARSISLSARVFPGSLLAEFDQERILQVLANLVGNALKFSREGGIVAVVVEPLEGVVRFTVADDGPGIESEKLDVIFDLFGQGTHYDRRGLGIGLYISRRIVEAHGGTMWVDSRPGEGSAFFFTLPAPANQVAP